MAKIRPPGTRAPRPGQAEKARGTATATPPQGPQPTPQPAENAPPPPRIDAAAQESAPDVPRSVIAPPRPKGGRPPILTSTPETLAIVQNLGSIRATTKEAAAVLGVTEPTFLKFKEDNEEVGEAWERGHELGKVSQRRSLLALAAKNGMVAIFMAMNQLGMKDLRQQWAWQGQGKENGKAVGDRRVVVVKGGLPSEEAAPGVQLGEPVVVPDSPSDQTATSESVAPPPASEEDAP